MSFPPFPISVLVAGFQTVPETSWQGSLVILLVLAMRRVRGARVPARWRHALWWLVLARLLVPAFVLPHSPASWQNVAALNRPFERVRMMMDPAVASRPLTVVTAAPPPAVLPQGSHEERQAVVGFKPPVRGVEFSFRLFWKIATGVWLAGFSAFAAWVLAGTLWWRTRLGRESFRTDPAVERIWQTCCGRMGSQRPPPLQTTGLVSSPALFGWRRPRLLIPAHPPVSFTVRDWEHVFLHEVAHLRRGDH